VSYTTNGESPGPLVLRDQRENLGDGCGFPLQQGPGACVAFGGGGGIQAREGEPVEMAPLALVPIDPPLSEPTVLSVPPYLSICWIIV
jgi:hypothetical protein